MADAVTTVVEYNGYKNAIVRCSIVSDGTGTTGLKIYDASSGGAFGVTQAGQTFYPGIHSKLVGLDYDVQDMKIELLWEGSPSNQVMMALGSAPEDFSWKRIGGLKCPPALTGATGSILLSTINAANNATAWLLLYIVKGVPQS